MKNFPALSSATGKVERKSAEKESKSGKSKNARRSTPQEVPIEVESGDEGIEDFGFEAPVIGKRAKSVGGEARGLVMSDHPPAATSTTRTSKPPTPAPTTEAVSQDVNVRSAGSSERGCVYLENSAKPRSSNTEGHVFVGELDTNDDEDEAGLWGDGAYVDERTGEELDTKLVRQPEGEEIAFLKRINL